MEKSCNHIESSFEQERPYLTEHVIFARQKTEFINPIKGIRKTIVNECGVFTDFPGFESPKLILSKLNIVKTTIPQTVCYRTEFNYQEDGKHLVIWEIQPDGWYWADEGGFGAEDDCEIRLYTYLDENGVFTSPFRIYNIGDTVYFGTSLENTWKEEQSKRQACAFDRSMDEQLPGILNYFSNELNNINSPKKPEVFFSIAGMQNTAHIYFESTSRGGNLVFELVNSNQNNKHYQRHTEYLFSGKLLEYEAFLKAPKAPMHIKNAVWTYYMQYGEYYENCK